MRKYYSELLEALHEEHLLEFQHGLISEAELREFEEGIFIDEEDETPTEKSLVTEHRNT